MIKKFCLVLSSILIVCLFAGIAHLCGPGFTFREYLDKRFWQPFAKYEDTIVSGGGKGQTGGGTPADKERKGIAFAGYSTAPAGEALSKVRKAYIAGSYEQARAELTAAGKCALDVKEREELRLIDAKLDMRMGERDPDSNQAVLRQARGKLEAFVGTARLPSFKSEARGWLARVHYLLGDQAAAVKIYLDELQRGDTVFERQSLADSLHMIFPYNGSSARLADHLEEYFDTPEHALFVVYIVTNPLYRDGEERAGMAKLSRKIVRVLQKHGELFDGSGSSDALALALMRAAIFGGDTAAALTYSKKVSPDSPAAAAPEFNWMVGACHFLQRDYSQAEAPLLRIAGSKAANRRELRAATRGLIGVYQKLGRPVDQLRAAFLYEKAGDPTESDYGWQERYGMELPEQLLDLPYLLDVQLTDEELREYLARCGKEARQIKYPPFHNRRRTAFEAVEYELAVRLARQEKYDKAAEVYERLAAGPRAKRMRTLDELYRRTADPALQSEERLKAQYEYASFLEAHSVQVFFNDMIWKGYQTWTFMGGEWGSEVERQGLTSEEVNRFKAQERRAQDEQEERWRAYGILTSIIKETRDPELAGQAAIKAIRCLDMIHTGRFGREDEIKDGREKLLSWLRQHKKRIREAGKPSGA